MAPVNAVEPSTKSGSAPEPPVSDVAVVVVEAAFTVTVPGPLSRTSRSVPEELENCSPVDPSAGRNAQDHPLC